MKLKTTIYFILTGFILISSGSAKAFEPLLTVNVLSNTDIAVLKSNILEEHFNSVVNQEALSPRDKSRQAIFSYQDATLKLNASHGAYHHEIGEQLLGLGLAYRNHGDSRKTNEVSNQALHIQRINEGLHNANQLPIIDLIILIRIHYLSV